MVTFGKLSFSDVKSSGTAEGESEHESYMVMTWLWNSMEHSVCANFMFPDSAKEVWDATRNTYSLQQNALESLCMRILLIFARDTNHWLSITVSSIGMIDEVN